SQALGQPVVTARDRNRVIVVVRAHHAECATFPDRCPERRQKDILDLSWRSLRVGAGLSLAGPLVVAIYGEMLNRGGDLVIFLQPFYLFDAHVRDEVWVFAINLFHTSPSLVTTDIHYG